LKDVLIDKYKFSQKDAEVRFVFFLLFVFIHQRHPTTWQEISSFLLPMLEINPLKRATAQQVLSFCRSYTIPVLSRSVGIEASMACGRRPPSRPRADLRGL
jgi:hypothetical protein